MNQFSSSHCRRPLAVILLLIFVSHSASAASPRGDAANSSQGDDMRRRHIAQINLLKQELAKTTSALNERELELETGRKALETTEQSLAHAQETGAELRNRLDQAIDRIQRTDERLQQTQNKLAGSRHQLQTTTTAKTRLEELALSQKDELLACEAKNLALYQANRELAAMYEEKGVLSALLQQEPVTGLKQVEIENILEEYRDKLDRQIYQAPTAALELPAEPVFGEF